jgi:glucose-6-phosphate isomerase
LQAARTEVLDDLDVLNRSGAFPPGRGPLDARFIDLPARLLTEENGLIRIRKVADRLAAEVDRVVVLGIGGSYMGAHAMFDALCHPYHNERSRQQRRNRPRLYFEGNNVDNDTTRGLLELLGDGQPAQRIEEAWGIIVISKSGETLETGVAFRVFLQKLRQSVREQKERLRNRIIAVSLEGSGLWKLVKSLGVGEENLFGFPEHLGGRFSVLSAVGLLPAAVLGLKIEQFLEGARAITERFQDTRSADSIVLDYVGICHLMESLRGSDIRVLSTWGKRLESFGLWYDQLLAESLGKDGRGATPLTVVNTRDLHSRGQQHQEGRRDRLFTNLIVDESSETPVEVPFLRSDEDGLNRLVAGKTLPEILWAAYEATNDAYAEDFRRAATIHLPRLDEYCLGQLFQMLMLATVVEGRLIGINPYGQPGVRAYKANMERNLQRMLQPTGKRGTGVVIPASQGSIASSERGPVVAAEREQVGDTAKR